MTTDQTLSRAERKKQELRQEIIDAAFECFAEHGYHSTGVAEIAAHLGIGIGTFYRFFQNKRDIVEVVINDLLARIDTALSAENAPDAASTLEQYQTQVIGIGDALVAALRADPRVPRLLLFEAPSIDKAMADRVNAFHDFALGLQEAYIGHGVDCGYLAPDLDVTNTARAINGMLFGAASAIAQDPNFDYEPLSAAIRRLMFHGITSG